jgi:hypothetical protein
MYLYIVNKCTVEEYKKSILKNSLILDSIIIFVILLCLKLAFFLNTKKEFLVIFAIRILSL